MKIFGALLIALLAFASPAFAQNPATVKLCIPTNGTACPAVTTTNPLPSAVQGQANITPIDCTSPATQKIATGGTAQNLFTASNAIHGFIIQNVDTTEPLCMSFTGVPVCGSGGTFVMQAGTASTFANAGSFTAPLGFGTNLAPQIIAATTNHPYACIKW